MPGNSRAIPILDLYEQVVRETDAKVVMLCANNYPAMLAGNFGLEGLFDFNAEVQSLCGLSTVEISDDFLGMWHLMNGKEAADPKFTGKVDDLAKKAGLYFASMGTGALFSYAHTKRSRKGFFEYDKEGFNKVPSEGQKYILDIFHAWADFASALGIQVYSGRRIATQNPNNYIETIKLGELSDFIAGVSILRLGEINYGGISPDAEITKSEAMNLALALQLNRDQPNMLQLVEQMQSIGMEPYSVEQVIRFNKILAANNPRGYFADMADNGHVGVCDRRSAENPDDYDLFAFADAYQGPIVFIHHNILLDNNKQPGTRAALLEDQKARNGEVTANHMPYPDRIRDINDYLLKTIRNPNVRLVIASPEPKCDVHTSIPKLAADVAEATSITADRLLSAGFVQADFPYLYVTRGYESGVNRFLCERLGK